MAEYDEYKLKDLAKNMNIELSGNLFSDVDMIKAQYVLDNAGTADYPKRELSYREAYRALEFRKKYESSSAENDGDVLDDFSVGAIVTMLIVIIILIVKFFKYPGKWLFVPILSVVTLLLSPICSYVLILSRYHKFPSGKEVSVNFVKFYSSISEKSFIWGIVFAVILSLLLVLILYPMTKKINARIHQNVILAKGERLGGSIFLVSSIALIVLTICCFILMHGGGGCEYADCLARTFNCLSVRMANIKRDLGSLWPPLFISVYLFVIGIFSVKKKEKLSAIFYIMFPFISLGFYIICDELMHVNGQNIYHYNSPLLLSPLNSYDYGEYYPFVSITVVGLYAIFVGVTLLCKSPKVYNFTHGFGHLAILVHLITLFKVEHANSSGMSAWGFFTLTGLELAKYGDHISLLIPLRVIFFVIYVLLIWSINMQLAKKTSNE